MGTKETRQLHGRRGIVLILIYIVLEAGLWGASKAYDSNVSFSLATLLTPLAFLYINATCFGGRPVWSGKRWTAVALVWLAVAMVLGL